MDSWFVSLDDTLSKCSTCVLHKKNKNVRKEEHIKMKSGNAQDVLFISSINSKGTILALDFFLKKLQFSNYLIIPGISCSYRGEIPSPINNIYKHCDCVGITKYTPKVIVTEGHALFAITKSDAFSSWHDFKEFNFNPTFFYTDFKTSNKIRVYPIPEAHCLKEGKFEEYFGKKQIINIKTYLTNYKEEREKELQDLYTPEQKDLITVSDPNIFLKANLNTYILKIKNKKYKLSTEARVILEDNTVVPVSDVKKGDKIKGIEDDFR